MARVLIVEDEPHILTLTESILQHAGYETVTAATLVEAQAIIDSSDQKLDLVFTDITLQEDLEGGLHVGQAAHKARDGVPVVYTSGRGLTDGMKQLFVESSSFLQKPYTDEQLIEAVSSFLRTGK